MDKNPRQFSNDGASYLLSHLKLLAEHKGWNAAHPVEHGPRLRSQADASLKSTALRGAQLGRFDRVIQLGFGRLRLAVGDERGNHRPQRAPVPFLGHL